MKFKINKPEIRTDKDTRACMWRIPLELHEAFNKALEDSNLSGQKLLDQMVEHCLIDAGYLEASRGV